MLSVLIAEDDADVGMMVTFALRMAWPGCQVTMAADGAEALRQFGAAPVDVVILDVQMPPPDGFAVCRRIREVSSVPILMLTVRDATLDKVHAFDLGADDYLTKPFDHLELIARLRALLRRTQSAQVATSLLTVGHVTLNVETHDAHVDGKLVRLTPTECRLLEELMRQPGMVVPHRHLLERIWGTSPYTMDQAYLKVYVRRLRQKLGDDPDQPHYIGTEWGTGYRFLLQHES